MIYIFLKDNNKYYTVIMTLLAPLSWKDEIWFVKLLAQDSFKTILPQTYKDGP